jgi:general secretion pathway protein D
MTVRPQVTALIQIDLVATIGGVVELPIISIQDLQTTVSVPDGGTLLLGGQKISMEIERELGVPLLSKVPVLRRLWTNTGRVRDEQTLLIMIRPKIIIQREEELKAHP